MFCYKENVAEGAFLRRLYIYPFVTTVVPAITTLTQSCYCNLHVQGKQVSKQPNQAIVFRLFCGKIFLICEIVLNWKCCSSFSLLAGSLLVAVYSQSVRTWSTAFKCLFYSEPWQLTVVVKGSSGANVSLLCAVLSWISWFGWQFCVCGFDARVIWGDSWGALYLY